MKIVLIPEIAILLETIAVQAREMEFSGFGFVRQEGESLVVYDFVLMNIGSYGYTEFGPEKILPLAQRPDHDNMRLWTHRHPLGNGVPGPHNWSSTDNDTIKTAPMGGVPEMVGWSASIVRTPFGWVGRMDNHLTKKTVHVPVEGQAPLDIYKKVSALQAVEFTKQALQGQVRQTQWWEAEDEEIEGLDLTIPDDEIYGYLEKEAADASDAGMNTDEYRKYLGFTRENRRVIAVAERKWLEDFEARQKKNMKKKKGVKWFGRSLW